MAETSRHSWHFFRAGGFDQVLLESGSDLLALDSLDQKLWVALSCPVKGVEFDRRTLELIDTDQDGHIRAPEVLAALAWAGVRLTDPDILLGREEGLPLAAINNATDEGRRVLTSARTILAYLGKEDSAQITVEDTCDSEKIFAQSRFNGDGVVTTASTDDEALKEWITTIIDCYGGETDRSGEPGVTIPNIEQFSAETTAWLEWQSEGEREPSIRNLGVTRNEVLALWVAVKDKIDDFFLRCRLAAYDERAIAGLNSPEGDLQLLAGKNLAESGDAIAALPLSAVNASQTLDLGQGVNPAWGELLDRFTGEIVHPLLGDERLLTATEWGAIKARFAPAESWWQSRADTPVAHLGSDRLRAWVEGKVEPALRALVDEDLALQEAADAIVEVERLTRYCRDLYALVNNYVSFRDFYTRKEKAIFQVGTLYLDSRSCELCVPVADIAKHAALATLSRVFLVYCDCVRTGGAEKMTIAAAMTAGDSDQIMVGRNGVFYDRQGNDWDATVVRIIDHPISIRQAFWGPYKRVGRSIGEMLQKGAAARSKAAEDKAALSMMQAGAAKEGAKPIPQQSFDAARFAGIFAAIGLAIGAIGTALASAATGFFKLAWWQMPLALVGIVFIISGPAMLIAWFKLRQRNLGPILDANGWAVNARAKLNIPFGRSLTGLAQLPEGSKQSLADPYAERKTPWELYLLLLLVVLVFIAWKYGVLKLGF
jgi:hypothetical protein